MANHSPRKLDEPHAATAESLSVGPSRTGECLVPLEACPQTLPNSAAGAFTIRTGWYLRHIVVVGDWLLWQGNRWCHLNRHHFIREENAFRERATWKRNIIVWLNFHATNHSGAEWGELRAAVTMTVASNNWYQPAANGFKLVMYLRCCRRFGGRELNRHQTADDGRFSSPAAGLEIELDGNWLYYGYSNWQHWD